MDQLIYHCAENTVPTYLVCRCEVASTEDVIQSELALVLSGRLAFAVARQEEASCRR